MPSAGLTAPGNTSNAPATFCGSAAESVGGIVALRDETVGVVAIEVGAKASVGAERPVEGEGVAARNSPAWIRRGRDCRGRRRSPPRRWWPSSSGARAKPLRCGSRRNFSRRARRRRSWRAPLAEIAGVDEAQIVEVARILAVDRVVDGAEPVGIAGVAVEVDGAVEAGAALAGESGGEEEHVIARLGMDVRRVHRLLIERVAVAGLLRGKGGELRGGEFDRAVTIGAGADRLRVRQRRRVAGGARRVERRHRLRPGVASRQYRDGEEGASHAATGRPMRMASVGPD